MESPPPGYERFCEDLWTLLSTYPPPFIYIQDLESTQTTFKVVENIMSELSNAPPSESACKVHYACVDAIACFTPKLLYEAIIHSLVDWEPTWEDGCAIWAADDDANVVRWNENLDTFVHGLRAAHRNLCERAGVRVDGKEKGKGKDESEEDGGYDNVRLVIVVERAERLKEDHPELLVPLTRLAELVCSFCRRLIGVVE